MMAKGPVAKLEKSIEKLDSKMIKQLNKIEKKGIKV
jgi:hypothetical protein